MSTRLTQLIRQLDNDENEAVLDAEHVGLHIDLVNKQLALIERLLQSPCDANTLQVLHRQMDLLQQQQNILQQQLQTFPQFEETDSAVSNNSDVAPPDQMS